MRQITGVAVAVSGLALAAALGTGGCSAARTGSIRPAELAERIEAGSAPTILDVRTRDEYADAHIPGAINIPVDELADRLPELDAAHGDEVVVHCRSGRRAMLAEQILSEAGYTRLLDLEGHMQAWTQGGYPTE